MRVILFSIIMLLLISFPALSQEIPKIDSYKDCVPLTAYIVKHKNTLDSSELREFLLSFSNKHCDNNVEFQEWGNEVLFSLIDLNPGFFFNTLFNLNDEQIRAVKREINSPIHDGINVVKIYQNVKDTYIPEDLKKKALELLHPSYEYEKKMIEEWERINNQKWEYP